jgi:hypothetical protein
VFFFLFLLITHPTHNNAAHTTLFSTAPKQLSLTMQRRKTDVASSSSAAVASQSGSLLSIVLTRRPPQHALGALRQIIWDYVAPAFCKWLDCDDPEELFTHFERLVSRNSKLSCYEAVLNSIKAQSWQSQQALVQIYRMALQSLCHFCGEHEIMLKRSAFKQYP